MLLVEKNEMSEIVMLGGQFELNMTEDVSIEP